MIPDDGYDRAKVQSQRDDIKTPGLTLGDVLDAFSAFAGDFENFNHFENFEHSENSGNLENVAESEVTHADNPASFSDEATSCSDKSESSFEDSGIALDEIALAYADIEDMEVAVEKSILAETSLHIDEAASAVKEDDLLTEGMASSVNSARDETDSLIEEVVSSPARSATPSDDSTGFFDDPISFIVHREDGSISCIETENYELSYQYRIEFQPKQVLTLRNLRFFIDAINQEKVSSSALLKYLTTMADIYNGKGKIPWLPALLRSGVSETLHELVYILVTLRFRKLTIYPKPLFNILPKGLGKRASIIWILKTGLALDTRQYLEEFFLVSKYINAVEARLFTMMNNTELYATSERLITPDSVLLFFYGKDTRLRASRILLAEDLKSLKKKAVKTYAWRPQAEVRWEDDYD